MVISMRIVLDTAVIGRYTGKVTKPLGKVIDTGINGALIATAVGGCVVAGAAFAAHGYRNGRDLSASLKKAVDLMA